MQVPTFALAAAGLTSEQLRARQERERHASNSVSILMSNGPAPSQEVMTLMQRYVDGELTLDQVDELNRARLQAKYAPPAATEQ